MIKKNKNEFNELIKYRKIGYGKVSTIDYSFTIDKEHNTEISIKVGDLDNVLVGKVKLDEEDQHMVDMFIKIFLKPKKNKVALFDDEIDKYEKAEIYYDNIIIEDDEISRGVLLLISYIQGKYEELSTEKVNRTYEELITSNIKKSM